MGTEHCSECGDGRQNASGRGPRDQVPRSKYNASTLIVVCLIFGNFGVHRFMVGKIGTGFLMLLTFGLLGFWVAYDLVALLRGKFTDKHGNIIPA